MTKKIKADSVAITDFAPMTFDGYKLFVPCRLNGRKRILCISQDDARMAIGFATPLVANPQNVVSFVAQAFRRRENKEAH